MTQHSFKVAVGIICGMAIVIGLYLFMHQRQKNHNESLTSNIKRMNTLHLTSTAFEHNGPIPTEYTCQGMNTNPPLHIAGVPEGTQSLALVVDDPDAPVGVWDHWLVWNIAPDTIDIVAHSIPPGALVGKTSSGGLAYEGPCPPSGTHSYRFTLYALSKQLTLSAGADKQTFLSACAGSILDQFTLIGLYKKT